MRYNKIEQANLLYLQQYAQIAIRVRRSMAKEPRYKLTFIRQWRQTRHMSLDVLADRVPMDKGNLSKIERGLLPYNQELLEKLADALQVEVASLIMRDPTSPSLIWSIWDMASQGERLQIERVAEALVQQKKAS